MNATKALFQSKKELRKWWAGVVDDPRFADVLLHSRSAFLESGATSDNLAGARYYEAILTNLPAADPAGGEFPSPGLIHHPETMPPQPGEVTKPKRKVK